MRKLLVAPSKSGYAATPGNELLSVQLSGGPSWVRRDFIGAVAMIDATWNLPPEGANYLQAFYRTELQRGALPFLIDLILDDFDLAEYQARFVPGSFRIGSVQGLKTSFSAQLEVKPRAADAVADESLMEVFEAFDVEGGYALGLLEELVNVDLHTAIGT
jgi:hypothetical protein